MKSCKAKACLRGASYVACEPCVGRRLEKGSRRGPWYHGQDNLAGELTMGRWREVHQPRGRFLARHEVNEIQQRIPIEVPDSNVCSGGHLNVHLKARCRR